MSSPFKYEHLYVDIIYDYVENKLSSTVIAQKYNISSNTVERILKRNDIPIRGRIEYNNKHYHNDNVFSSNNEEIPYWVGFLLTDGCVHEYSGKPRAPYISLQLKESDKDILEEYANFLEYKGPITQDKQKRWRVQIHSYQIAKDLEKFNVKPNKTFDAEAPDVFCNTGLFWRGVIDGDGSVYLQNNILRINFISVSFNFVEQFQRYCNTILNNKSFAEIRSFFTKEKTEIFRITYSGKFAIKILESLYAMPGPRLKRKYELYLNSKGNTYAMV